MRFFLVTWAIAPVLAAQSTWVVDHAGGGNFLDIPAAIAAASPGDRIVVLGTATYSAFVLDRGLDIEAVSRAVVPTIEVVGVPAGERARVAGFDVARQGGVLSVSVRLCQGTVLLVDLVETGTAFQTQNGKSGLELYAASRVFVDGGVFLGQPGSIGGGDGLRLDSACAVVRGATFRGGVDVSTFPSSGSSGRPGISLAGGSQVLLSGVVAIGGHSTSGQMAGGDGGDGIRVDAGCKAYAVDACWLEGELGSGGSFYWGADGHSARGDVEHTLDCTLIGVSTGTAIANRPCLSTAASVAVGSNLVVDVQGEGGSFVVLAVGFEHGYSPQPLFGGALALTTGHVGLGVVLLDGAGHGSSTTWIPAGPWQDIELFIQGVAPVANAPTLTAPAHTRLQ